MSSKTKTFKKKTAKAKSLKKQETKIDFDSWFWFKFKEGLVREVQKKEIQVFFSQKGLKDKEEKSRYDEILKLY